MTNARFRLCLIWGDDMNSIDNLRDYVLTAPSICSTTRAILVGYVDEIEREVEELRDRDYRNGMEDGEMAAERDGWVRLPVDADGEPIHVGDVMDNIVCPSVHREVTGVGVKCFYGWDEGNGRYSQFDVVCYRHHHAPTVEDVLREFGKRWNDPAHYAKGELVETFAEKLRLAGDGE